MGKAAGHGCRRPLLFRVCVSPFLINAWVRLTCGWQPRGSPRSSSGMLTSKVRTGGRTHGVAGLYCKEPGPYCINGEFDCYCANLILWPSFCDARIREMHIPGT